MTLPLCKAQINDFNTGNPRIYILSIKESGFTQNK